MPHVWTTKGGKGDGDLIIFYGNEMVSLSDFGRWFELFVTNEYRLKAMPDHAYWKEDPLEYTKKFLVMCYEQGAKAACEQFKLAPPTPPSDEEYYMMRMEGLEL